MCNLHIIGTENEKQVQIVPTSSEIYQNLWYFKHSNLINYYNFVVLGAYFFPRKRNAADVYFSR